jgi:hypothetical protein
MLRSTTGASAYQTRTADRDLQPLSLIEMKNE